MAEQSPPPLGDWTKKKVTRLTSIQLSAGDKELLDWLCNYLGITQSEAVRTSIRSMVNNLSSLERRTR